MLFLTLSKTFPAQIENIGKLSFRDFFRNVFPHILKGISYYLINLKKASLEGIFNFDSNLQIT